MRSCGEASEFVRTKNHSELRKFKVCGVRSRMVSDDSLDDLDLSLWNFFRKFAAKKFCRVIGTSI